MTYEVKLSVFQGPLDLLLHLIERQELDITVVALAQVTDQYLAHLRALDRIDPAYLADFLIVAARLLLIKSRLLLPQPPPTEEEGEEDVGDELVRRLREYQRFKAAARLLEERETQGLRSYVRVAAPPALPHQADLSGLTLDDLLAAMRRLFQEGPAETVARVVAPLVVSLGEKVAQICETLRRQRRVLFSELARRAGSRLEIIVTFLAILELMKQRAVRAHQDQLFGEIVLEAVGSPEAQKDAFLPN